MKVVYIAGPFRAKNSWDMEKNIRIAEEAALEVWKMGAAVICPHTNTRFFQGAAPDEVWLDGDIELLKRSDAVLMVGDWTASTGATAEHTTAIHEGLYIAYDLPSLKTWLGWHRNRHGDA